MLFLVMLAAACVIWLVVVGVSLHAVRTRRNTISERAGGRLILWGGGIFPVVVLLGLVVYGLMLMPQLRRQADGPTIAISAERFWWRIRYDVEAEPGVGRTLPRGGVEGANELWLPVGRRSTLLISSPDVIHSFWVPAIAGKVDAIPGRVNRLVVEPMREGVYNGICAEFCGEAHAQMGFRVVVAPEADYEAHVAAMAEPAGSADHPGLTAFLKAGCGACHAVRGTDAGGKVGPNLTHVGARRTIAAGLLPVATGSMADFVRAPDHLKPGVEMPAFGMLADDEIEAIAAWLEGLK
ncbi:cytochrome c oxidase subunit II [Consotaella aegiceratis]|uniref:cytochrome c oxidase subunit II n=1 Tax=Consotaella aegiceratis TaxID=3097961 RepID=UPI002F40CF91